MMYIQIYGRRHLHPEYCEGSSQPPSGVEKRLEADGSKFKLRIHSPKFTCIIDVN